MASPHPPFPLTNPCSVIIDNTLYVYSSGSFQSLPLKDGGKWKTLPRGVPVLGATCVKGTDTTGNSTLWVIGGIASAKSPDYTGLQVYSFSSGSWQTITPLVPVTRNLQGHGATFLNTTGSILVYGGSPTSPPVPSSQTFLISTTEPYDALSFTSKNIPALYPIVLPWDGRTAIAIGGNEDSTAISRFTHRRGWHRYKTKLTRPLKPAAQEQALIVHGSDGSKVLEVYDMSVSPNTVSQFILENADGRPGVTGAQVGSPPSKKRKRDLTLKSWPTYNGTNAPKVTRSGFSLAQAPNGLVAISGGNEKYPVELFNEDQNSWIDTTHYFGVQPSSTSHSHSGAGGSPTTSSGSTSSTSATTTAGADPDHPETSLILGATLGSILGFIALLVILLLIVRWRRHRRLKQIQNGQDDEKQRMSFADRGAPFMKEAGGAVGFDNRPHDSIAIMGNGTTPRPNHQRTDTRESDSSTARLVPPRSRNGPGMNDAVEMETIKEKSARNSAQPMDQSQAKSSNNFLQVKPNRSSGWSRYFSGNALEAAAASGDNGSKKSRTSALSQNSRTSYNNHDCSTHGPTEIPPLNLGQQFTSQRVSRVVTGGPSLQEQPPTTVDCTNETTPAATLHREGTTTSTVPSTRRPRTISSTLSSNPPSTIGDTIFTRDAYDERMNWTPVTHSDFTGNTRHRDTNTSSVYSMSHAGSELIAQTPKIVEPSPAAVQRGSSATVWPKYDRSSIQYEPTGTNSATTAIPVPAATVTAVNVKKPEKATPQSDMSWVNLGPLAPR